MPVGLCDADSAPGVADMSAHIAYEPHCIRATLHSHDASKLVEGKAQPRPQGSSSSCHATLLHQSAFEQAVESISAASNICTVLRRVLEGSMCVSILMLHCFSHKLQCSRQSASHISGLYVGPLYSHLANLLQLLQHHLQTSRQTSIDHPLPPRSLPPAQQRINESAAVMVQSDRVIVQSDRMTMKFSRVVRKGIQRAGPQRRRAKPIGQSSEG